jgi:hypothetical protein
MSRSLMAIEMSILPKYIKNQIQLFIFFFIKKMPIKDQVSLYFYFQSLSSQDFLIPQVLFSLILMELFNIYTIKVIILENILLLIILSINSLYLFITVHDNRTKFTPLLQCLLMQSLYSPKLSFNTLLQS